MADVLRDLNTVHALVVNGSGEGVAGIDELTTVGPNVVAEIKGGHITMHELDAREYGFERVKLDELGGGTPEFNASITRSILKGQDVPARVNVVLLNAGAALYAADAAPSIAAGIEMARDSIHSGKAIRKLDALVAMSQKFAV
jgi:anthranilate phosphoribosyltransferase